MVFLSYRSPTEVISKPIKSHIKDTKHVLERLAEINNPLADNILRAAADVESLYTNIQQSDGVKTNTFWI